MENSQPHFIPVQEQKLKREKKTPNLEALETRITLLSFAIMETLRKVDTYDGKDEHSIFDMLTCRLILAKQSFGTDHERWGW